MDAPPVQYVTTSDGYNIAYAVSGTGPALVFASAVWNHAQNNWLSESPFSGRAPTLHTWAKRFRVITYDSRGQGLSQRGLAADHTSEAYERDLEAVVDHLKLERFTLHGAAHFGHVAMRFAVKHPERVEALILHNCSVRGIPAPARHLTEMARNDWNAYVHVFARSVPLRAGSAAMESYFKEGTTQADFLKLTDIALAANIEPFALRIRAPTLIIAAGNTEDAGKQLASLIPNSRLVIRNDVYVEQGETTPMASIVEAFLDEVLAATSTNALSTSLSTRELEVMRLIAMGQSNRQIADSLVISPNTVGRHVSNIFDKLGFANRAEATAFALRHGLA
jgi:DNA-binding CsgD family transcriptional regulator/pimeloyl-ACP methyl ester carboxylesterase